MGETDRLRSGETARRMTRHHVQIIPLTEKEIQMAPKHEQRCPATLIIREMQMKAELRQHCHLSVWQSKGFGKAACACKPG